MGRNIAGVVVEVFVGCAACRQVKGYARVLVGGEVLNKRAHVDGPMPSARDDEDCGFETRCHGLESVAECFASSGTVEVDAFYIGA